MRSAAFTVLVSPHLWPGQGRPRRQLGAVYNRRLAVTGAGAPLTVLRHVRHMTPTSLFAFATELCRDRDVTPDATRIGQRRASGASPTAAAIAAEAGAQARAENFPVALRFLPRRYRGDLAAVYGFARSVDDMGDEAAPEERAALLDELEADVGRLYRMMSRGPGGGRTGGQTVGGREDGGPAGPPRLSVVRALAPGVVACAIPAQPFYDLI